MRDKYAVYFIWNDGFEDAINCTDAKDRDLNIKEMVESKEFKSIEWCRIYASGEYGKHNKVL